MSYYYHFADDETKVQWSSYLPKVNLPGGRAGFQIQLFNTKVYAICTDSSFVAIDLWHKGQVICPLYASVSPCLLGKIRLCDHRAHCNFIILRFCASPPALFANFPRGHPLLLPTLLLWNLEHKIYTLTSIFKSLPSYQLPFIKVLLFCQDTAITRKSTGDCSPTAFTVFRIHLTCKVLDFYYFYYFICFIDISKHNISV